ncbi:hypothetical protein [Massilia suwonensis]|uniref:Lipoprotein n=1 Tax=Massilia suwonensis TaxID=648895 RepID=A0ABW0MM66_9BURK
MKRLSSLAVALVLGFNLPAQAACPAAEQLIDAYDISFSGFGKPLPKAERPQLHGARTADLVVVRLPNRKGKVPDGFQHSALLDKGSGTVWIRRKGGFVPVDEWYGPVKLKAPDLAGCAVEAYR